MIPLFSTPFFRRLGTLFDSLNLAKAVNQEKIKNFQHNLNLVKGKMKVKAMDTLTNKSLPM